MRYCGNCGRSFDPVIVTGRTCPWCGAAINRTGDIEPNNMWDGERQPTQPSQAPQSTPDADAFSVSPTAPAYGFGIHDPHSMTITTTHRGFSFRPVVLLALVALALLLVFGSVLLLNNAPGHLLPNLNGANAAAPQTTATNGATSPGAQPSPTGDSQAGGPLSTPGAASTPGAPTPSVSPDGSPTPESTATPTVTPAPGQPDLAVSPAKITIGLCLNSSAQFTVTNTGDGVMTWSASGSRSAYKFSPQNGSLDSGQKQTVTVSGISASGSVQVDAPGAANTPQTVTITCSLL